MKRVITYGTFDLLHYGHINLLKRAKDLGDYLIVALSTDEFNLQKDKISYFDYQQRKILLESIRYVDLVIPEISWEQKREDVKKYYADIFVIGDDWEGKFDFEAIEKANQFDRWRKEGKHLVLRFVLDLPGQDRHQDIPDWLYQSIKGAGDWYQTDYGQGFSPDYSQEALIKAHDKAVAAMGQRWGQDGFVSFIELGSVGHWGEWHVNYEKGLKRLPSEDILERYVSPWRTAFPKTQILMRRPFKWEIF